MLEHVARCGSAWAVAPTGKCVGATSTGFTACGVSRIRSGKAVQCQWAPPFTIDCPIGVGFLLSVVFNTHCGRFATRSDVPSTVRLSAWAWQLLGTYSVQATVLRVVRFAYAPIYLFYICGGAGGGHNPRTPLCQFFFARSPMASGAQLTRSPHSTIQVSTIPAYLISVYRPVQ